MENSCLKRFVEWTEKYSIIPENVIEVSYESVGGAGHALLYAKCLHRRF